MTRLRPEHPTQSALKSYALEELAAADVAEIAGHLLLCDGCRQVVAELDVFAPVLRRWGRRRVSAAYVHETDDGPIRLELRATPDRRWAARFWGEKLEGSSVFSSADEAYAYIRRVFSEMYPEHVCTGGCGGE